MKKRMLSLLLALIMILSVGNSALACTGTYVGKDVSKNGSTLICRTEDIGGGHPKSFVVYPAADHKDGEMYEDQITGFKWPQAMHTYQYCAVPDSDGYDDDGIYDEVGYNEKGVAISATVSADYREEIEKVDPLIDTGLREADITTLVLSRCSTAKEGVKLLGEIIDKEGAAECNVLMIADHKEAWYMEIVSGHQYVAIKLPTDVCAVIPNCLWLDYVDVNDTENVIASKELISMPEKHNLIKKVNGKFSVRATYAPELQDYDRARVWGGQNFLAPSKKLSYESNYNLFFKPDKKVSLKDVMELQKYRYEGTKLDGNKPENKGVRVIGIERQVECHIIELKENFPAKVPGILWLAMGNAEHNVYVPYFPNLSKTPEAYAKKSSNFDDTQAYWVFRGLSTLAELNRDKYGKSIREYWSKYQDKLIEEQDARNKEFLVLYHQDPKRAVEYANEMAEKLGMQAFKDAKSMYSELFRYVAGDVARTAKKPFVPSIAQ
ncbi:C69 family dipeptidase [Peptoniphilus mikwangii]|uniref:C69 family dipeptidase n=1 Tax=Peptoniphilus mikwangii TaxID=1354300 RepID=UPI000421D11E|nr:C69 family dipeptidase [Peptoniphilus mikwangii]